MEENHRDDGRPAGDVEDADSTCWLSGKIAFWCWGHAQLIERMSAVTRPSMTGLSTYMGSMASFSG